MSLIDQIAGTHRRLLNPTGGCHSCPRRRIDYVPATLKPGTVLWLGEAPYAEDVKQGEGFTSKSGQYLKRMATEAGVPEPWSFSHTIHCRPPNNDDPKPKEISCCLKQFVIDEVKSYQTIVMVGNAPLAALFPGATATHFRGNIARHPDFPGQKFYAIDHPSYILRRQDLEPQFRKQLERLGRIVRGEPVPVWTTLRSAAAMAALRVMVQGPILSFDLETDRVNSWELGATIRSFSVTADGKTIVAIHGDEPEFAAGLQLVAAFIADADKMIVGSNPAFDVEWMEREFNVFSRCSLHDVGVWWYEAGQYKQVSLKQLVAEQLDGYRFLIHNPHLEQDVQLLLDYNAEDVVYALQLFYKAARQVRPTTADLVTRVLSPATLMYREMQTYGLYLRQDYRRKKIEEYEDRRATAVAAWKAEDPDFIPDTHESGDGLLEYLFEIKKLPVMAQTSKGTPVTDQAVIKQYIRDGATYLRFLLENREYDKFLGTYLKPYDKLARMDGRLHPRFWLNKVDTSRPSASDPNVFNIPRDREIRDLFGVPAGHLMVESDLSQIEFRIMVCRAQDENGIAGYMRGEDAHTMTARTIAEVEHPTKAQRTEAKPVNFALLYGGDWPVVQRSARDEFGKDWSEATCQKFTKAFFTTYPRIKPFHEHCVQQLILNKGWFESVTGHVFHYADWDAPEQGQRDHAFRSAINSEGQGPAANICFYIGLLARRLLNERGFTTVKFMNSVYDSIMTDVPNPAWVPDVVATINEAAQLARQWVQHWFVVPLIMEHAVGESWGSLEEIKNVS